MTQDQTDLEGLSKNQKFLYAMSSLKAKVAELEKKASLEQKDEPIAIVGLGCRYPGGVVDSESYWDLLKNGREAIIETPEGRWDVAAYYDENPDAPGKVYTTKGGFLKQPIDTFDPQFFRISPKEAQVMDPQQRLLLEVSWEALENAGLDPNRLSGTQTGVFVGLCTADFLILQSDPALIEEKSFYAASGSSFSVAAGRISYTFGFQGPCIAIDTACSSSLVAIHQACQSLQNKECNLALAGGVSLILSPNGTISFCKAKALSVEGHCKTFDSAADGFVRSEGCGVIVLKRLSDALAQKDRILSVIRSSAVNQDGASGGLTVPNGLAQQSLIRQALARAKLNPNDIDYIEAHGTGTKLGDPIEVNALGSVLREGRAQNHPLWIGTVKTNFGHTEAAAGVAGVIKVILSMQNESIPPHLHLSELNPHISLDDIPARIPTELVSWPRSQKRRIAGVSSFGFSGTNAHVILEEAPLAVAKAATPAVTEAVTATLPMAERPSLPVVERPVHLLALSAQTETALDEMIEKYSAYLASHEVSSVGDLCFSAATGRSHFEHRLAILGENPAQILEKLQGLQRGQQLPGVMRMQGGISAPKIAFMFTGGGSQYVGMGRELYETQPTFRKTLDRCAKILDLLLAKPLLSVLWGEDSALLDRMDVMQPAVFALEYSLFALWKSWGVEPLVVLGHSLGEYVAATVAGVFSLEDGLKLISKRALLMHQVPGDGAMASVAASERRVLQVIAEGNYGDRVSIGAINGPESTMISGNRTALKEILSQFEVNGVKVKFLQISNASHSLLMDPILDEFERVAGEIRYSPPQMHLISNVTGKKAEGDEVCHARYWRRHLRESVRFADGVQAAYDLGCRYFVELGPSPGLLGMGQECIVDKRENNLATESAATFDDSLDQARWLPSLRKDRGNWQQILESVGELYVQGVDLDWVGFEQDYNRTKIPLPTYPFQKKRYWFDESKKATSVLRELKNSSGHPLLGQRIESSFAPEKIIYETNLSSDNPAYLKDHAIYNQVIVPATAYFDLILAAGEEIFGRGQCEIRGVSLEQALVLQSGKAPKLQLVLTPDTPAPESGDNSYALQILSKITGDSKWHLHLIGTLGRRKKLGTTLSTEDLSQIRERMLEEISSEQIYSQSKAMGVEYGPSFQGVEKVWRGKEESVGKIRWPKELSGAENKNYNLHPAILDACFQILGLSLLGEKSEEKSVLGEGTAYLPIAVESLQWNGLHSDQGPGSVIWSHVTSKPGTSTDVYRGEIRILTPTGQVIAELQGVTLMRASKEAVLRGLRENTDEWLYEVEWREKKLSAPSSLVLGKKALIFVDSFSNALGLALEQELSERGETVTLVESGTAPEDYPSLIRDWMGSATENALGKVIHVLDQCSESMEQEQKKGYGSVLSCLQALLRENVLREELPALYLVTRTAQQIGNERRVEGLSQSPVWGLARVIRREYPELKCICVDLDSQEGNQKREAQKLITEFQSLGQQIAHKKAYENEVGYRLDQQEVYHRYGARLARKKLHSAEQKPTPFRDSKVCREEGSYLISGGLGALGGLVAQWLVEHEGARNLILLGRKAPSKEALQNIEKLQERGARVWVSSVDVAQESALADLFAELENANWPSLRGVVHAAGVLADGMLEQQNWDGYEKVMAPKVLGAWNLHRLTEKMREKTKQPLDFFVCFSSVASLLGSAAQGNYAAANSFLDSWAAYRNGLGLVGLSINWGAWAEIGLAAELVKQKKILGGGMESIPSALGMEIFGKLLRQTHGQIGVMPMNWPAFLSQSTQASESLFFEDWVNRLDSPVSSAKEDLWHRLENCTESKGKELLLSHLQSELCRVLGLDSSHKIDAHKGFKEMGMDSLMAVNLRNRLKRSLGDEVKITPTIIFQYPTLAELAQQVLELVLKARKVHRSPTFLTVLQKGDPRKAALFLVPPIGGEVIYYQDLCQLLGKDQPIYGFQAADANQETPVDITRGIKELAAMYVDELIQYAPSDSYALGGASFGGLVAYEMGRQLAERKMQVSCTFLMDAPPPGTTPSQVKMNSHAEIMAYLTQEGVEYNPHELQNMDRLELFKYVIDQEREKSKRNGKKGFFGQLAGFSPALDSHLVTHWLTHQRMMEEYRPEATSNSLIYFRPSEKLDGFSLDFYQAWSGLGKGEFRVHQVPGDHFSMCSTLHASDLAELIKAELAKRGGDLHEQVR
jgi:acyl transferase domain-containing protein/thioesterase domain-containing protein